MWNLWKPKLVSILNWKKIYKLLRSICIINWSEEHSLWSVFECQNIDTSQVPWYFILGHMIRIPQCYYPNISVYEVQVITHWATRVLISIFLFYVKEHHYMTYCWLVSVRRWKSSCVDRWPFFKLKILRLSKRERKKKRKRDAITPCTFYITQLCTVIHSLLSNLFHSLNNCNF